MFDFFEGLEKFGLKSLGSMELYKKDTSDSSESKDAGPVELLPEECLFDKKYNCPVCDAEFNVRTIKQGKTKLVSTDSDLRSYFTPVDPLYYDVISCTKCGYTSLNSTFRRMSDRVADKILKELSPQFKPVEYPPLYTAEIAVERYKLALLNCLIKGSKDGEKAYICMKLAWLYRELSDLEKEKAYQREVVKGFVNAFQNESFPICGLDEKVVIYIIGETLRRLGDYEEAGLWLSKIILDKGVSNRLRDRAKEQREEIKKAIAMNQAQEQQGQAATSPKKKFKLF